MMKLILSVWKIEYILYHLSYFSLQYYILIKFVGTQFLFFYFHISEKSHLAIDYDASYNQGNEYYVGTSSDVADYSTDC